MNNSYKVWAFNEAPEINHWGVQFTDGKYKGVVVEVLEFTSKDHQDGDTLGDLLEEDAKVNLGIEFQVIHNPENLNVKEFESEEFTELFSQTIGQVIKDIKDNHDKQDRILDIEESDQR